MSVPGEILQEARQLARRRKRCRSEVYNRALAEYVAQHAPDRVTESMDRVLAEIGEPPEPYVQAVSSRTKSRRTSQTPKPMPETFAVRPLASVAK